MEDEADWHRRNRKLLTMGPGDKKVGKMKKLMEYRRREHWNN